MHRFLSILLLLLACGPRGTMTTPILSGTESTEPPEPAPSAYEFPARTSLQQTLDQRPAPTALFEAEEAVTEPWQIEGELPTLPAPGPHETDSPAGQLITELAAAKAGVSATDGASCLARGVAQHLARHGKVPSQDRRTFIAARCGIVSPELMLYGRSWGNVPARVSAAEFFRRVEADVRPWVEGNLPSARTHAGLHVVAQGTERTMVLALERPRAELETVRPTPDDSGKVLVRGRLLVPATVIHAFVNQGPVGVTLCRNLPGYDLPAFAVECPMAEGDSFAGIDIMVYPPNRALGEPAAQLVARRPDADASSYEAPDVGPAAPVTDAASFATTIVERVNLLRSAHSMGPVRLAQQQSEAMTPAMPHFFADGSPAQTQDLIALTMLAGWDVGHTIHDATLSAFVSETTDAALWLARSLDRPMMRAALMDPNAAELAVAPVVERGGIAALVTSYELFDAQSLPLSHAATTILEHITEERAARGLPAPRIIEDRNGALAAEVDRVRTDGKAPNHVLHAAMNRASREWGSDVEAMLGHVGGDPRFFEVPDAFLTPGPLRIQAASTFHQAEGAPWGQWLVVFVIAR